MQDLRKVHVVYSILTDVIEPALRLRIAQGHPREQNDGRARRAAQLLLELSSALTAVSEHTHSRDIVPI